MREVVEVEVDVSSQRGQVGYTFHPWPFGCLGYISLPAPALHFWNHSCFECSMDCPSFTRMLVAILADVHPLQYILGWTRVSVSWDGKGAFV